MDCEYGCEREAKFPPRKGKPKWSCEEFFNSCPNMKEKCGNPKKGISYEKRLGKERANELKKLRSKQIKLNNPMSFKEPWNKGKTGVYSEEALIKMRNANTKPLKGKTYEEIHGKEKSIKLKSNLSKRMIKMNKNTKPWNKNLHHSSETIEKIRNRAIERMKDPENRKKSSVFKTMDQIQKDYPLFCKVEWIEKSDDLGKFKVHCKNHNCKNSKENSGYFIAPYKKIYERIRTIENEKHGSYIYCSEECKDDCIMSNRTTNQIINFLSSKNRKIYHTKEYNIWRQEVLKRADYKCEYCGNDANTAHHIKPQKLEPFFSLDPDYGVSCCRRCHYKYGHEIGTECSTTNLANILCEEKNNE